MSHVAKYAIQIKNANMYITKNTAELMIKKFGAVAIHQFTDLFGNLHKVQGIGIRYKGLSMDIQIEKGELKFLCDKFQKEEILEEFIPIFKQNYQALATAQGLREIGYTVTINEEKGKIKVTAQENEKGEETVTMMVEGDGSMSSGFSGFKGKKCLDEAKKISEKLGGLGVDMKIEDIQLTEEGHLKEEEEVNEQVQH